MLRQRHDPDNLHHYLLHSLLIFTRAGFFRFHRKDKLLSPRHRAQTCA